MARSLLNDLLWPAILKIQNVDSLRLESGIWLGRPLSVMRLRGDAKDRRVYASQTLSARLIFLGG
jgi:hypothetical protein